MGPPQCYTGRGTLRLPAVKHNRRTLKLILTILLLLGAVWGAIFAYVEGFTSKWKRTIIAELKKNGLDAEISRLTIDPFNGLTARGVRMFDTTHQGQHLAEISHISLDVDLGKLVRGETFLRTVDLRGASLTLPIDPDKPAGEQLEIRQLNAWLTFSGERVDITKAEGVISGVKVNVRGSLDLPKPAPDSAEDNAAKGKERRQRQNEIKQRRTALREVTRFLAKIQTNQAYKALLDVEVNGPVSEFRQMDATMSLTAHDFRCGEFRGKRLQADAVLSQGAVMLRKLEIEDSFGGLTAEAQWHSDDSQAVDFWIDSSVDLHALLKGLWPERSLGEVVFYHPPHVKADGKLFTDQPWTSDSLPLDAVARFDCRRFTTHGVIFDGFHADARVQGQEFFVRNLELEHHSGSALGQFMRTAEAGFRYELAWKMELNAALPFVGSETARQWMADFEFGQESQVSVVALGAGADLNPSTWSGSVQVDLRNFTHRDLAIRSAKAEVTLASGKQVLRDVALRRADGEVTVKQITIDSSGPVVTISDLVSTTMPHPVARSISKNLARQLQDYVVTQPPRLVLNGVIHGNEPERTEYTINLTTTGKSSVRLGGEPKEFTGAAGTITRKNGVLSLDLTGRGVPGITYSGVTCLEAPELTFQGEFGLESLAGKLRHFSIAVDAPEAVQIAFAGKNLPARMLKGRVEANGQVVEVEAAARVVNGEVSAHFEFPDIAKRPFYQAEMRADKVDFARLAKIYDPSRETQGEISGWVKFSGEGGDASSLSGTGRLVLRDGDVFAIPWLGPLSKLMNSVLPVESLTYSTAREAGANISLKRGTVATNDFEAQTRSFRLKVDGVIDYLNNKLDLTARMNARGAPGLLLYPFSKLLEYEAQGTLSEPNWRPKHLGIPFLGDKEKTEAKKPNEEEVRPARVVPGRP